MVLVSFLASGALGDVRLSHVGPAPVAVGVLSGLLIMLGAVPSAVAVASPERPSLLVAKIEPDGLPDDQSDGHSDDQTDPE